jgi:hypothetical protein
MTVLSANRYAGFGIRRTRNGPVGRLFEMRVEFGFETVHGRWCDELIDDDVAVLPNACYRSVGTGRTRSPR